MSTHSVEILIPDEKPFDQQDCWFETFVGSIIEPVVCSNQVSRFWFTRYGAVARSNHALFRFETEDVHAVLTHLSSALSKFGMKIAKEEAYDVAGDIGRGQSSRFLGTDAKHQSESRRGGIAFTFLHASATLMLDCLVGPDASGYFHLESETGSGFSRETSLEQYLHLFCNMTCVPTFIAIGLPPGSTEPIPISYEEFKGFSKQSGWRFGGLREARF
jgi:hypothetical protein